MLACLQTSSTQTMADCGMLAFLVRTLWVTDFIQQQPATSITHYRPSGWLIHIFSCDWRLLGDCQLVSRPVWWSPKIKSNIQKYPCCNMHVLFSMNVWTVPAFRCNLNTKTPWQCKNCVNYVWSLPWLWSVSNYTSPSVKQCWVISCISAMEWNTLHSTKNFQWLVKWQLKLEFIYLFYRLGEYVSNSSRRWCCSIILGQKTHFYTDILIKTRQTD